MNANKTDAIFFCRRSLLETIVHNMSFIALLEKSLKNSYIYIYTNYTYYIFFSFFIYIFLFIV